MTTNDLLPTVTRLRSTTPTSEDAAEAARQPAPVVGDEELLRIFERASNESFEGDTFRDYRNLQDTLAGVCAVRDAILAAQAVQVPDLEYLVASALDDARCVLTRAYAANDPEMREVAKVAIRAIEQAKGGQE